MNLRTNVRSTFITRRHELNGMEGNNIQVKDKCHINVDNLKMCRYAVVVVLVVVVAT